MIWRTGTSLLVAEGDAFALVDATGSLIRWYGARSYSDEDDLWTWDHHVDGRRFCLRTRIDHAGRETRCDNEVVFDDLEPADTPAMRGLVAAALHRDAEVREAKHQREQRAADARVAAIAGAQDVYALGDDFARAQKALAARVAAYSDPIAAALLRTLVALGKANAASAVIVAYARGCRHACFELNVPPLDGSPDDAPAAARGGARSDPGLAQQITAQAGELERLADDQEAVDARHNASAYRNAAQALARAAAQLA